MDAVLTPPSPRFADLTRLITQASAADSTFTTYAPFTGASILDLPACTPADVAQSLERARTAQRIWQAWPAADRAAVLLRFHDLVLARREDLIDLMQLECGKARRHAAEEVFDVAINARYYAVRAARWLQPRRRKGALPLLTHTTEYRRPLGVVGVIAPWNYPLTLAVSDAIPALLAGNSVILKPAEQTSLTALRALHLLHEAGLPHDVFQIVTGQGETLGPPLLDGVDAISFTGSTEVGRLVAAQAGRNLIPASMELGGKNPMLVLDDADLERAVEGAVRACFANAGQLCVSAERIYVQQPIYHAFRTRLIARIEAMHIGPAGYAVEMGSLVSAAVLEKVEAHVADARARGAVVLTGGVRLPNLGPLFYAPTLLENVSDPMHVAHEETFGPVASLYPFSTDAAGVALANDSLYGLNASVWTRSVARGRHVAAQLACGTVNINEAYAATWGSVDAPMGGMKASGVGRRHGREGFFRYTEPQTIAVQRLRPLAAPQGDAARTYARVMGGLLRAMRYLPGLR